MVRVVAPAAMSAGSTALQNPGLALREGFR